MSLEQVLRIDRPDEPLREKVVNAVRQAILSGALQPGRRLTERELIELTGVSRTSVREALRQLQSQGLVESTPTRGLRVATLDREDVQHIYEMRAALEPTAAELFVKRATDDEIAELIRLRDPSADMNDLEQRLASAYQVDNLLLRGARNPILTGVLEPLHTRIHALRRVTLSIPGRMEGSRREYQELVEAIRNRQAQEAKEASLRHVTAAAAAAAVAIDTIQRRSQPEQQELPAQADDGPQRCGMEGYMSGPSTEVAIVGVGQTDFGALYASKDAQRDENALGAEALRLALEDAGLQKAELDGLLTARVRYDRMANIAGVHNPRVVNGLEGSGRMSGVAVQHAAALIRSGQADVVACVYGNNGRSVKMRYGGDTGDQMAGYDLMYGMTSPGASVAMMYQRYKQTYGAPEDALAPLAINNRRNAVRNPVAVMRSEIDTEQYLNARYIAEPLRLFDYCIINDGGVALILTSLERARSLRKRPVRIAATATMGNLTNYYTSTDFFYSACRDVGNRVYRESGLSPEDMDCLEIYDNFTPTILFSIEGFGHAERGSAWEWIRDGRIQLEGKRPVNTSGGHTGESYMQGWALHVEAVRQVRGECGDRQVSGCSTAQYMCASPIVSSHVLVGE